MAATGFLPNGEKDFLTGCPEAGPGMLVMTGEPMDGSTESGEIDASSKVDPVGDEEEGGEYRESLLVATGFRPNGEYDFLRPPPDWVVVVDDDDVEDMTSNFAAAGLEPNGENDFFTGDEAFTADSEVVSVGLSFAN
jgi:hypothetical protein